MKIILWITNHLMLIGMLYFFIQLQFFPVDLAKYITDYALFLFFAIAAFIELINNKLDKLIDKLEKDRGTD